MGHLLTFAEAKASRDLANVSGVCGSGDQFRDYLNQAVEALMTRGNWFATVQKIRVCVHDNCVVWPRFVGTILATNICGARVPQKDFWYEFLQFGRSDWPFLPPDFRGAQCGGNAVFENAGTSSVFANVPCNKNFYVRAYLSVLADIGKKITIFGIDGNGQTIRTVQNGTLQEGVVLTLASPFSVTPFTVRRIDRVVKDQTQGVLRLYFFDGSTLWDCATYDPTETSPSYNFSRLVGFRRGCVCNNPMSIEALVKMDFVPVQNDTDLVQIRNTRAIKHMIQCIRKEDEGRLQEAAVSETNAFRELNYELRNKFPIEQFTASFNPFGTANFQRVSGGMI